MIAVINYGMGNLCSVLHGLEFLGANVCVTEDAAQILAAEKLILPGVGSFRVAMENIRSVGLFDVIRRAVLEEMKPILGICLGMQLLAEEGTEDGVTTGLGLVPGRVERFSFRDSRLTIPHIGFNTVRFPEPDLSLAEGLGTHADFYFVHSYRMLCRDAGDVAGWCNYGGEFTAMVRRGHIYGTQFHPEKSQTNGLRMLENYVRLAV